MRGLCLDRARGREGVELVRVVQHGCFGGPRRAYIVVHGDRVQELRWSTCVLQRTQAEMHVPEQLAVPRRPESRRRAQLTRAADIVDKCGRQKQVAAQARMQLRELAADGRDADGVLEEPAGVRVVAVGRRGVGAERRVGEHAGDERAQPVVVHLRGEELEEALELVCVPAQRGREGGRIRLRRLKSAHLELQAVAELLHAAEHVHGVALGEARVEQLDVAPDPPRDAAGRVGELECEVGRTGAGAQALFLQYRVDAVDDPVLRELGDGAHGTILRYGPAVALVRPFRAERYGERAGELADLVAPPYDVIGPEEREKYLARSPYNVVHLTLPDSEQRAADDLAAWRADAIVRRDGEPGAWALSQSYVGPDGVSRTRNGVVVALQLEPYDRGVVLPHERTHAGPKEGRLRLLRATRTQLEPIFLLHDGDAVELPARDPDLTLDGERLWRLDFVPDLPDLQLLIADGHHRYETALAFHDEDGTDASRWLMVVLVSTREEGLTIFPTHRVARRLGDARGRAIERPGDELPGVVLYRGDGRYELIEGDGLDVEVVDKLGFEGVTYTPRREEAEAEVDRGDAEGAFLLRPTRIEDVFAYARRGQVLPQKTTYFFPKLTSGLLFFPLD